MELKFKEPLPSLVDSQVHKKSKERVKFLLKNGLPKFAEVVAKSVVPETPVLLDYELSNIKFPTSSFQILSSHPKRIIKCGSKSHLALLLPASKTSSVRDFTVASIPNRFSTS
jgi:hypothetical protein